MRILVTGSSGFIGGHLATALVNAGHDVHGLDIRPAPERAAWRHHPCDLLDARGLAATVSAIAPECIMHLAARTDLDEKRSLSGYAANIEGVENLLDAVRATASVQRCIITSSQLVCRIGAVPAHDLDYSPSTLYGESKVRTERVWRESDGGGRTWCITRPTTIWGPGMNPHYLRFFALVRDGRYFHIGDGATRKSYGFVGNTVHQYLRLLAAPDEAIQRQTFYIADYEPMNLREWAECFRQELAGPPIRHLPAPLAVCAARIGDALNFLGLSSFPYNSFRLNNVLTESVVPLERTRSVCGPLPFSMRDGVQHTVAWLQRVWGRQVPA